MAHISNQTQSGRTKKPVFHDLKRRANQLRKRLTSKPPKLNAPAPKNLSVWTLDKKKTSLDKVIQKFQSEKKGVVLNFGSYTCPIWRGNQGKVQDMVKQYPDQLAHVTIYFKEAHPSDGWSLEINEELGISYKQPKTLDERLTIAKIAKNKLMAADSIFYVDGLPEDEVTKAYAATPIRLCMINEKGDLVYRSKGSGPGGYKPDEFEAFLKKSFP